MPSSMEMQKELEFQIRSNRSLIYITSHEEHRVDDAIQAIACDRSSPWSLIFWDIAAGAVTNSESIKIKNDTNQLEILEAFKDLAIDKNDFCMLILHDFYKFLAPEGNIGQVEIQTIRSLKNLIEKCNKEKKCVILTGAHYFLPTEFEKIVSLIDWSLPDKDLINKKVTSLMKDAKKRLDLSRDFKTNYDDKEIEEITRAFQGLTIREIEMIITYFILTEKDLNPIKIISKKKDIIKKLGLLEWMNLDIQIDQVGGLSNLKNWLEKRKSAFSDCAKEYGLPSPSGLLVVGVQGCGKSRIAKAVASFWELPLIRLDIGSIFQGIVGSSESNMRSVIKMIESISPCVLFIDEIDKAFSGSSVNSDSGTSSRVFGTFLTWMQDKTASVFVISTANVVANLPPELIRKGRFDEIFFVDLPDDDERKEIWKIHLEQRDLDLTDFNIHLLIAQSRGFSGAEIEAAIISAMYESFSDNKRPVSTVDIIRELGETIPISVTMKEKIDELRSWAEKRARSASKSKNGIKNKNDDEEL